MEGTEPREPAASGSLRTDAETHTSPRCFLSDDDPPSGQLEGDSSNVLNKIAGWASEGKRWKDPLNVGRKTSRML